MKDAMRYESHRPMGDYTDLPGARRPWLYPERQAGSKLGERVALLAAKCAKCPWPDECHHPNCDGETPKRGRLKDEDEVMALYQSGLTDADIGRAVGLNSYVIGYWRRNQGLKKNEYHRPKRAGRDPCPTCYSRAVCQACGGTCGEKERYNG